MSMINLDFANSLKLILPDERKIRLELVGCGGTGSWLAPAVVRVGKLLIEKFGKAVEIAFYDPDRVEEKNIYRQNFCDAEIGKNKASALAERYGLAWGMEVMAIEKPFSSESNRHFSGLRVIIGCVDRASARKEIMDSISAGCVWLDCGNTRNNGQVLCGVMPEYKVKAFAIPGYCGMLPLPGEVHPELVETEEHKKDEIATSPSALRNDNAPSCADMALLDSQGLAINQRMAAEAADYLVRMLITKDLRKFATYIDLESGTTQSKYITEKEIKSYAKS